MIKKISKDPWKSHLQIFLYLVYYYTFPALLIINNAEYFDSSLSHLRVAIY